MNQILYEEKNFLVTKKKKLKKQKVKKRSQGRPLKYFDLDKNLNPIENNEIISKTFRIRYDKKISSIAKFILNSFQKKYIYYAIDDILYNFQLNIKERDHLLAIIYSPVLSLQNNFSINFFDIWIQELYIHEISKSNKFINNNSSNLEQGNYITLKLFYRTRIPIKKSDSIW